MRLKRLKKKIPTFKTDRAAAAFVDKSRADAIRPFRRTLTRFEIKPKDTSINLRLFKD